MRGECFVHKCGDFSYPFGATAKDFVQTTDPIIKQSCYIQSTKVAYLNLWVKISKLQTKVFVCNSFIVEDLVDSGLYTVKWVTITWDNSRFRGNFIYVQ